MCFYLKPNDLPAQIFYYKPKLQNAGVPILPLLPIKFNLIKDYVNNVDNVTRKIAIPEDKSIDLVNLVLRTIWDTFNSKFKQQTDGAAIGGPGSSTTAET